LSKLETSNFQILEKSKFCKYPHFGQYQLQSKSWPSIEICLKIEVLLKLEVLNLAKTAVKIIAYN